MNRRTLWVLVGLYVVTLGIRLALAFQAPAFSGDESYFALRQIEHITETGLPMYQDPLSYGEQLHAFCPFFHYIAAFFNLFLPITLVAKVLPNVAANCIVFAAYLLGHKITQNRKIALLTAGFSAFIPVYVIETFNSVTPLSFFFPAFLFLIYSFLNLPQQRHVNLFIALMLMLTFTNILVYLVVFGFFVYLLLVRLERMRQSAGEVELIIFSVFLVFWSQFLIFKDAFRSHGAGLLLQNIPAEVITHYFHQITVIEAINKIGILPLIGGLYVIYKYSFSEKKRPLYLLLGFMIVAALMLWLKLVPLHIILILAGILLMLLFSQYMKIAILYVQKSKAVEYQNLLLTAIVIVFLLTSGAFTISYATSQTGAGYTVSELEAMRWLRNNAGENATILSTYQEGNLISYMAGQRHILDSSFLLAQDVESRFEDVGEIYTTTLSTRAIELLNKYEIDYILLSNTAKDFYNINGSVFSQDIDCFEQVYEEDSTQIIRSDCVLSS